MITSNDYAFDGKSYVGEAGYIDLLKDIISRGVKIPDRTGVGCRALFDAKLIWKASDFPFFTHRKVNQRPAFEELWFMLRGETDTRLLEDVGVNFWKGNTSREFLDARGLTDVPTGDMGKAYGWQWRNFGGTENNGFDQLSHLINELKVNRYGRRHVISLWNPLHSKDMALTPCWYGAQFVVLPTRQGDMLHLKLINRSVDAPFGLVYAVQQYKMLQLALCKMFGFLIGELACDLTHVHVYENQVAWAIEATKRERCPQHEHTITLNKDIRSLDDLLKIKFTDWEISYNEKHINTTPFQNKKPSMAI